MRVIRLALRTPTLSDLIVVILTLALGAMASYLMVEYAHMAPRAAYILFTAAVGSAIASTFGVSLKESGWLGLVAAVMFSILMVYMAIWIDLLPH
jgi:uncharacterized transporter YbjL